MQLPDTDRFVYLPIRKPRIMDESFKRDVVPEKAKKPELVSKAATKIETIPQKRPAPDSNIAQEKPKQPKIEPLIKGSPDASKTAKQEGSNKKEQLPDTKKPKIRVAIESCTVVEENSKDYEIQDPESISLVYPNGNEKYLLAQPKSDDYDPIDDIYTTVQLIASDCVSDDKKHLFGDKKAGIVRNIVRACHKKNFVDLKKHMLEFNTVMQSLKDQHLFDIQGVKPASPDLILHAFNQAYARSIAPHANQLNKYQGTLFSFRIQ